ncbi:FHA domain-containing protein [Variovorax sp. VNK109]|uniref:FHA domain-containing protein n=1 Tax=Variovorax sp. VNK109 TaxID=3400919 RepID=UPI003C0A284A
MLGLLEAFDRNGALLGRLAVKQWPVTVGRGLAADLVLDEPHVAEGHLRIDRPAREDGSPGAVTVQVMDTVNGVRLRGKQHARGESFEWPQGQELSIGRVRLLLRLADVPIPAEQPLPRFPWGTVAWTVGLLGVATASQLGQSWLEADETRRFLQQLPFLLLAIFGSTALWAGLWALTTKLFSGRLFFWRHVRIASVAFIATQVLMVLAYLLAFMFSLESLSRFAWIGAALVAATGVAAHLGVIAPRRRMLIASSVAGLMLIGIPALLGTNWLQNKRLSNELYMAALFPPDLRASPAVPVPEFMNDARALREKLDARLKDGDDDNAPEADAEEE